MDTIEQNIFRILSGVVPRNYDAFAVTLVRSVSLKIHELSIDKGPSAGR